MRGKVGRGSTGCILYRDHPRLCGEKVRLHIAIAEDSGSPPPMRGKGKMAVQVNRDNRITPAYAGKSFLVRPRSSRSRDHPRLCGEKRAGSFFLHWLAGSPPPMRGKDLIPGKRSLCQRITPAYAGKSIIAMV